MLEALSGNNDNEEQIIRFIDMMNNATTTEPEFRPGDGKIFEQVLLLCYSADENGKRAREFVAKSVHKLPSDFDLVAFAKGHLEAGGDCHKWMLNEITKQKPNIEALSAWQTTISVLGKHIHVTSGTTTLNHLLTIAEKGFRSDEISVRKETFRSWAVLIDNFATNESVITSAKRVKLITRPLVAHNNFNKEILASAKFDTWWHFILRLGHNAPRQIGAVIVPFLEFCYGKNRDNQNSPVKKYSSLNGKCIDAFAQLLSSSRNRCAPSIRFMPQGACNNPPI